MNFEFSPPQRGIKESDCEFYTFLELPNEIIPGTWDLRGCVDDYLGRLEYKGQTVLEIGPASGYLTAAMEARGASVTCIELGDDYYGDVVPHASFDMEKAQDERVALVQRLHNSFWLTHERAGLRAKVWHGDVRKMPVDIGHHDIGLIGAVMLHCRDPLGLLLATAARCDTIVFTDAWHPWMAATQEPFAKLVPTEANMNTHTWWEFSPSMISNILGVLGFDASGPVRHRALLKGNQDAPYQLYTLVASRTRRPRL